MAEEKVTTMKAYEKDVAKLLKMYGPGQPRAFRLALAKSPCEHPEGERRYTTALIPAPGEDAITKYARMVSGFRCMACGKYVFPEQSDSDEDGS